MTAPIRRWNKLLWFGAAGGALAAGLLLYFFNPEQVAIYPLCQFRQWTGLDCPGCGGLRAMHQLLHGNVIEAIRFNALAVLLIPTGAALAARSAWNRWTGRRSTPGRIWWWILVAFLAGFGICRNLI